MRYHTAETRFRHNDLTTVDEAKYEENLGTRAIGGDSRQLDTIESLEKQFMGVPKCSTQFDLCRVCSSFYLRAVRLLVPLFYRRRLRDALRS